MKLTLPQLAGGFEKLLSRLPGPIRKPVEREWQPLHQLFLQRRAPRLLVVGLPGTGVAAWFSEALQLYPANLHAGGGPWATYHHHGKLEFSVTESEPAAQDAILNAEPDLVLYVAGQELSDIGLLSRLHAFILERHGKIAPIVAVASEPLLLLETLNRDASLRSAVAAVVGEAQRAALLAAIAQALPLEARLEFARVSGERSAQVEIAAMLTRSASAVCTAIGAQPIPLADFPIITSLQVLMVSGIVHSTGRPWDVKLVRDFIAALGANIGLGMLFREGARAVVKLLPGWGNAISGAVAGAGTYAIGRAATAFFIEGLPMEEAHRRFKFFKRKKKPPELQG